MLKKVTLSKRDDKTKELSTGLSITFIMDIFNDDTETFMKIVRYLTKDDVAVTIEPVNLIVDVTLQNLFSSRFVLKQGE